MLTISLIVVAVFVVVSFVAVINLWSANGCNFFDYILWVGPCLEALAGLLADVLTVIFDRK